MSRKTIPLILIVLLASFALAACAPAVEEAAPVEEAPAEDVAEDAGEEPADEEAPEADAEEPTEDAVDAALVVEGLVDNPMALSLDDLLAMEQVETVVTNKDGEDETFSGVSLASLLEAAGVQEGTGTVTFVAVDGYFYEMALADLEACADCIVAIDEDGGLRTAMPGMEGKAQVKSLVSIGIS